MFSRFTMPRLLNRIPARSTALTIALSLTIGLASSPAIFLSNATASHANQHEQNSTSTTKTETKATLSKSAAPSQQLLQPTQITDGIYEYLLPTGQAIYIKPDHSLPMVTMDTWVETGSVNEGPLTNGISHFLEHLLFKGTPQHPLGEFDHTIEALGGQFNAATSLDYTHYYISIPSKHFNQAMDLHANMLQQAVIPQDALDRERHVVQEEINRALDNPSSKLLRTLNRHLFANHGYAYDTLGPKALIATVPRKRIVNYYHTWYQPDRYRTIVTGDVNPNEAATYIANTFAQYQRPQEKNWLGLTKKIKRKLTQKAAGPQQTEVLVLEDANITQSYFMIGFLGPNVDNREDTYALDVAMNALGQGKTSRLHQSVVEKNQLAQSISAGNWTQKYAGLVYIDATLPNEKRDAAREDIFKVIHQLKAEGLTSEELNKAKTEALTSYAFLQESTSGLAQNIGYNVTIGNLSDHTDYAQALQTVGLEDAQRAANKYLNLNNMIVVEMVPAKTKAKAKNTDKNNSLSLQDEKETIQAQIAHALQQEASLTHATPSSVEEAQPKTLGETHHTLMPNGMTLLSRERPHTNTVSIKFFIKGGKSTETVPGTANVVASMLKKGSKHRSKLELSQTLERNGMSIGLDVHSDYISISGSALKEDLGELALLMIDTIKHPRFEQEELDVVKTRLKRALTAGREKPSALALENLQLNIYPWHNYGNTGKRMEDHLSLITRDVLTDYYAHHAIPSNMVVSAVGNLDGKFLSKVLLEAFPKSLNIKDEKRIEPPKAQPVPPIKESKTIRAEKPEQAATWIARGWLAPKLGDKDYAALKVINTLLGSGLSSRLFVNLREKQGLAYVAASYFPSSKMEGRFVMYLGTDPKNEAKVLKGFQKEIDNLINVPLTDKELADAKTKFIGNFAMAHETNSDQAFYLGFYEALGQGAAFDSYYPKLIDKLTIEDIQNTAQRIFSQPSITSIVSPNTIRLENEDALKDTLIQGSQDTK